MTTFLECVEQNLDEAAELLGLTESEKEAIKMPYRELSVVIPIKMDNGSVRRFKGFRIQHNTSLGPAKGGIRFHPDETIDTVRSLASLMCWKCSLAGLPLGGGKGGIICNPKELSIDELQRLSRGYINAVADIIGDTNDIMAPDVYTNPQTMAWMMDQWEIIKRKNNPGIITGKPIILGGSLGRNNATAMGGIYTLREAAKKLNINLKDATFITMGFGNAGMHFATLMYDTFGSKLIAASDSKGAIYNQNGINPYELKKWKEEYGTVYTYPKAIPMIDPEKMLELETDVLVLAALEGVITEKNAENIKAHVICELANGPVFLAADHILYRNGVHVIPDFLCNAGGVTCSHYESIQNRMADSWSEEDVYRRLDNKITEVYNQVYELHKKKGTDMRHAAFMIAISRVLESMKLRGIV